MFINKIFSLNIKYKILIIFICDLSICFISSLFLLFYFDLDSNDIYFLYTVLLSILSLTLSFYRRNIYISIIRYSSFLYLQEIIKALIESFILYFFIFILLSNLFDQYNAFFKFIVAHSLFIFFLTIISRIFIINFLQNRKRHNKKNIIIYGAGIAGMHIMRALANSNDYNVKAIIDDDKGKINRVIERVKVYDSKDILRVLEKFDINEILISISNLDLSEKNKIIKTVRDLNIEVKILPPISEIINGKVSYEDFENLKLEDLIERNIDFDHKKISKLISKKSILISGAGGSIGTELSRQVTKYSPNKIILLDHSEINLHNLKKDIDKIINNNDQVEIKYILGSISDNGLIEKILDENQVEIIYHAAAYKHVPIIEENIYAGIGNNIFSSINFIDTILKSNYAKKFIMISTDKAVRPTSIMGFSKRIAELYIQSLSELNNHKIDFSIVRFGNVIGSSGSVVPLFYEQIQNGGPVTVTDKNVTRFLMSIKEAVGLILTSTYLSKGNEIFLLDMGEPIKIIDLAEKIIHMSGKRLVNKKMMDDEIEIIITGLRSGEKLYEELLVDNNSIRTSFENIYIAKEPFYSLDDLNMKLNKLREHYEDKDEISLKKKIKEIISIDYANKVIN